MAAVVFTVFFVIAALVALVTGLGCLATGLTALALANFAFSFGIWLLACASASRAVRS